MARARVIIQKRNNVPLEKEIRNFVLPLSEKQTFVLSEETVKEIRRQIERLTYREGSTGRLASSFFAEKISEGYGIGNIDYLNQNAKYWHWCLREDTEVYVLYNNRIVPMSLNDLYKNKEKINKILTPYGLKDLKNIWETFPTDKYCVDITNYMNIHTSGKHKFLVKVNKNILEKKVEKLPKKSLDVYSFLYASLNSINSEDIIDTIDINGKILKLNYNYGYILGFILGDGYISKNKVTIGQKFLDTGDLLEEFKTFCNNFDYEPKVYRNDNRYGKFYSLNICRKDIVSTLSYFIEGRKDTKKLKNLFLNSPENFRKGILSGYKFSDGRKGQDNGDAIRTISKDLRHQLLMIASSLGYDISYLQNQKPSGGFAIKSRFPLFCGSYYYISRFHYLNEVFEFIKINIINKDREKRDSKGRWIFEKYIVPEFNARAKRIDSFYEEENNLKYYDLSVDGELFLINNGIVTHNCNYGIAQSGRTVPPQTLGRFEGVPERPSSSAIKNQKWIPSSDEPTYLMLPTKPIEAKNYIEHTVAKIPELANLVLNTVK